MMANSTTTIATAAMTTAAATTAATHTRDNHGLLARAETRTLLWLAQRLPAWVHSDHLSGLGLMGMLAVGAAFALGGTYPAALPVVVLALAVNWFGDSLDGTLARVRDQQRPRYGYYVDHALDIAGTAFLFGGLALGGLMTPAIAMGLMAAYFAVMAEVFLATSSRGVFRMSFLGFGPTELRVVLSLGAICLMRNPYVMIAGFGPYLLFDVGGMVAIAGLAVTFVASSIGNGRALYEAEPRNRRAP
jgi:archaetidylinositol phosphate synthase